MGIGELQAEAPVPLQNPKVALLGAGPKTFVPPPFRRFKPLIHLYRKVPTKLEKSSQKGDVCEPSFVGPLKSPAQLKSELGKRILPEPEDVARKGWCWKLTPELPHAVLGLLMKRMEPNPVLRLTRPRTLE